MSYFSCVAALAAFFFTVAFGDARADIVAKWSFEGNLLDTAPAGGTSDHLSGAALNGPLATVFVPGIVGQAVRIGEEAGDATVLTAPDSNDLDLAPSFTIEAFVYRTVEHGGEWERFATKWFNGSLQWHWAFRAPPGRSQDLFMNGSQQINQANVSADIGLGEWHHVAITGDPANGLRLWQNGAVVGSSAYVAPAGGVDSFQIGNASPGQSALQFSGWVDEFQIHNVSQDLAYMTGRAALISGAPVINSFTANPPVISEGESTTLSWSVDDADTLTLDGGTFSNTDVTGQTSVLVSSITQSTNYTLSASNGQGSSTAQTSVSVGINGAEPVINEFLASNDGGHTDEDGDASDWIEIFNPAAAPAMLAGWYLTDDATDLTKWQFPAVSVPGAGYLLVFASDKNRALSGGELHTNFKLTSSGEYLALVKPDGVTVAHEFAPAFPAQKPNVSYGLYGNPPLIRPLYPPTPGAFNQAPDGPFITSLTEDPNPAPGDADAIVIQAEVASFEFPVASVTLHYRVNFDAEVSLSMTDAGNGNYSATIPASASVPGDALRWRVTAGDSSAASSKAPAFADSTGSPEYHGNVIADSSVGTLPVLHWFVANPGAAETSGGTRASLFFNGEFYDNVYVRIRGDTARGWPKKSYKFDFNDGHHFRFDPNLPRVDEINVNSTYTDKSYVRTVLAYESFRDAGSPYSIAFPLRLERNGAFYSVAHFVEQPDRDYLRRNELDDEGALYKAKSNSIQGVPGWAGAATSGIEKKNRKHEDASDLQSLIDSLALNGTALDNYLFDNVDIPAVVNNMATNVIIQNIDRTVKNFYLYRDSDGTGEWMFFPWDVDLSFGPNQLNTNTIVTAEDTGNRSSHPYMGTQAFPFHSLGLWNGLLDAIIDRPDTREMFLRRVRTLGDAFLNTTYYEDRIDQLVADLGPDVLLDRADWGSSAHFPGTTLSLQAETDRIKNEYLVGRRSHLFVTHASTASSGDILVPESAAVTALVPTDSSLGDSWKLAGFNDATWLSGSNAVGYERSGSQTYTPLLGIDLLSLAIPAALRIDANGDNVNDNNSCYVRYAFDVADKNAIAFLQLRVKYDDGFAAYLNGTKVAGRNDPASPAWNSAATTQHIDSQALVFEDIDITAFKGALLDGANVLAVQAMNFGSTSSDMLIACELRDTASGGGASGVGIPPTQPAAPAVQFGAIEFNPTSGNQDEEFIELVNPNAFAVDVSGWSLTGGVTMTLKPGTVIPADGSLYLSPDVTAFRSRGDSPTGGEGNFVQGKYSGHLSNFGESLTLANADAMPIAQITTPVAPSDAQRFLVVSEFHYHPAGNPGEEFIELLNISDTVTLDLNGVKFASGIDFDLTGSLAPGARVLVVRDQAAFEAVYGASLPVVGVFANLTNLNNDGETIKIDDATNSTVSEFTYNDKSPWPELADGSGPSLVLIDPLSAPDPDIATNWRPSATPGGSPGGPDAVTFSGDPNADLDGNGQPDLIDHALLDGGTPVMTLSDGSVSVEFVKNLAADDVTVSIETSTDLSIWNDASATFTLEQSHYTGTGGQRLVFRAAEADLPANAFFLRLKAEIR